MQHCFRVNRAFEDFPVGSRFFSASQSISAEEIIEFARRYDPQPFHLDSNVGENLLGRSGRERLADGGDLDATLY